ncbi:MAG: ATP-binding cassette domain-containing protein, partial [Nitrososphaeria archaeon]
LVGLRKKEMEDRIHNMLALMDLESASNKLVRDYSGGMIRKLEIAQSLLHQPKVLLLDEPTVGLDPIARHSVWEVLETLRENFKVTILITTHYMDEAEALCNRLAILERGQIVTIGSPKEIIANTNTETLEQAFIALLGHHIDEGGDFGETRAIRRTTRRLR